MGYSVDIRRTNKNVHCNNYGQLLLSLCKTNNLLIVNGRFDNNSRGDLTFRNISAIDYFLCDPDIFKHIDDFIVKVRNPILSDGHSVLKELGTSRTHSAVIRCLTICQHIPVVRKNHKNQLTQQFDIICCFA